MSLIDNEIYHTQNTEGCIEIPRLSIGELLDKFTIICLKVHAMSNNNNLVKEKEDLRFSIRPYLTTNIVEKLRRLFKENQAIWDLENEIRITSEKEEWEEIGKKAVEIRLHNSERVRIKNEINKLFDGNIEIKIGYTGFEEIVSTTHTLKKV